MSLFNEAIILNAKAVWIKTRPQELNLQVQFSRPSLPSGELRTFYWSWLMLSAILHNKWINFHKNILVKFGSLELCRALISPCWFSFCGWSESQTACKVLEVSKKKKSQTLVILDEFFCVIILVQMMLWSSLRQPLIYSCIPDHVCGFDIYPGRNPTQDPK